MEPDGCKSDPERACSRVLIEVRQRFNAVDTNLSGRIGVEELQSSLISRPGKTLSEETCQLLLTMCENVVDGKIEVEDFQTLYNYTTRWFEKFQKQDIENTGYIGFDQMSRALTDLDIRLSEKARTNVFERGKSNNNTQMSFDEFLKVGLKVARILHSIVVRDKGLKGVVSFGYGDLLNLMVEQVL